MGREIVIDCKYCGKPLGINRHTIGHYNIIHVDEDIEGDYHVICPHCKHTTYVEFIAELTFIKIMGVD